MYKRKATIPPKAIIPPSPKAEEKPLSEAAKQLQAYVEIAWATFQAIEQMGYQGMVSGHLYAAMQTQGISLSAYNAIIKALKDAGKIRESGHVLYAVHDYSKEDFCPKCGRDMIHAGATHRCQGYPELCSFTSEGQ